MAILSESCISTMGPTSTGFLQLILGSRGDVSGQSIIWLIYFSYIPFVVMHELWAIFPDTFPELYRRIMSRDKAKFNSFFCLLLVKMFLPLSLQENQICSMKITICGFTNWLTRSNSTTWSEVHFLTLCLLEFKTFSQIISSAFYSMVSLTITVKIFVKIEFSRRGLVSKILQQLRRSVVMGFIVVLMSLTHWNWRNYVNSRK